MRRKYYKVHPAYASAIGHAPLLYQPCGDSSPLFARSVTRCAVHLRRFSEAWRSNQPLGKRIAGYGETGMIDRLKTITLTIGSGVGAG